MAEKDAKEFNDRYQALQAWQQQLQQRTKELEALLVYL